MPSKSKSQAKFFAAAAHNPEFAKKAGISQSAAKEWNAADEKEGNLKKGSKLPNKVKESSMRGLVDIVQDAELADTEDRTSDIMDSCEEDHKEKLEEMPQRFDSFQGQDRDEFVDKTAEMTGKHNMVKFAEHKDYDVRVNSLLSLVDICRMMQWLVYHKCLRFLLRPLKLVLKVSSIISLWIWFLMVLKY